jgi:hypothetical protein
MFETLLILNEAKDLWILFAAEEMQGPSPRSG